MDDRRVALSTLDNPHSPFDEFPLWFAFDEAHGYGTTGYLARIVNQTEELGEDLAQASLEAAIDEIIEMNLQGNYIKIVKGDTEIKTVEGHVL